MLNMKSKIKKPNPRVVQYYLKRWDSLDKYVAQESSLKKLFTKIYTKNSDLDEVLIKVCSLNDFYSTNIFDPIKVARHIVSLNIDTRLKQSNQQLVNEIALVKVGNGKNKNFYSFATKYCSHHKPEHYPIYDSFVEKMLLHFRRVDKFSNFKNEDLKQYPEFIRILHDFKSHYGLDQFTLKEIDKYLWQDGKLNFPKSY